MVKFRNTSRIRNAMPDEPREKWKDRKPVIARDSKSTGSAWVATVLAGVLLLIFGMILTANTGPSPATLVLLPTGIACFLVAAIIKQLEKIFAELRVLNGKR